MGAAGPGAGATYGLAGGIGGGRLIEGSFGTTRLGGGFGCVCCASAGPNATGAASKAAARMALASEVCMGTPADGT